MIQSNEQFLSRLFWCFYLLLASIITLLHLPESGNWSGSLEIPHLLRKMNSKTILETQINQHFHHDFLQVFFFLFYRWRNRGAGNWSDLLGTYYERGRLNWVHGSCSWLILSVNIYLLVKMKCCCIKEKPQSNWLKRDITGLNEMKVDSHFLQMPS